MTDFRVDLIALVAGNPNKAWREGTEPDDVWEDQSHSFTSLEDAKDFIRSLPEAGTTHVKLFADDEQIFEQDAGADHLDDAAPGVEMPHTVDFGGPVDDSIVVEGPPLMPSQSGKGR